MRTWIRYLVPCASLLLLVASGCGDAEEGDGKKSEAEAMGFGSSESAAPKKSNKVTKKNRGRGKVVETKANPNWDKLAGHFFQFSTEMDKELHSKTVTWRYRDAFKSNIDTFFAPPEKKVAIKREEKKTDTKTAKKADKPGGVKSFLDAIKNLNDQPMVTDDADKVPTEPLLKHPLENYRFQIIMTGISNPEVLVEDPDGKTHIVRVNDRIGNEGGFVKDILKQDILVQVPEVDKPVVVSLAPPIVPVEFVSP
jgi:hypothetical protein